jgi:hypothetical protein
VTERFYVKNITIKIVIFIGLLAIIALDLLFMYGFYVEGMSPIISLTGVTSPEGVIVYDQEKKQVIAREMANQGIAYSLNAIIITIVALTMLKRVFSKEKS